MFIMRYWLTDNIRWIDEVSRLPRWDILKTVRLSSLKMSRLWVFMSFWSSSISVLFIIEFPNSHTRCQGVLVSIFVIKKKAKNENFRLWDSMHGNKKRKKSFLAFILHTIPARKTCDLHMIWQDHCGTSPGFLPMNALCCASKARYSHETWSRWSSRSVSLVEITLPPGACWKTSPKNNKMIGPISTRVREV